jgi:hypothetical protein
MTEAERRDVFHAAASLAGVLHLSSEGRRALAERLFAIAKLPEPTTEEELADAPR